MQTRLYKYMSKANVNKLSSHWDIITKVNDPFLFRLFKVYIYSDKYETTKIGENFLYWGSVVKPYELDEEFTSHEIMEMFIVDEM